MTLQINREELKKHIINLIRITSTDLPADMVKSIKDAAKKEKKGSSAENVFKMILKNIELAKKNSTPICQDTGTNIYYISKPVGVSSREIESIIKEATTEATKKSYLRPNSVDSLTGENPGDNSGIMTPFINFEEWDDDALQIKLMLKGGGCENVSTQYTLPDANTSAGRDLDGVYKCVVDAINNAQGLGCAPGVVGVGIGGDRTTSMIVAKKQLFRKNDDTNTDPKIAKLENKLTKDLNTLGIGPMGFGGKTTVFTTKIGHLHRLPASFFVSISYMCWAHRRHSLTVKNGEYIYD